MEKRDVVRIGAVVAMAVLTGVAGPATAKSDEPLQAIPFTDVTVTGSFWKARLETNRKVTIPYDFKKCDELGLIDNFARAAGFMPADTFQPNGNNGPSRECDVYKTIEGASYVLAEHRDVMLDLYLDTLIDRIAAAQEPDGYLYPVRRFRGKLGTATGFYSLDAWGFPVLGLPDGRARRRPPSRASSLLRKLSLPSGQPVCVRSRICASSASFNTRLNSFRHASADICPYQSERSSNSDLARSSVCAAALDHSYRHGRRHSLARTGFSST